MNSETTIGIAMTLVGLAVDNPILTVGLGWFVWWVVFHRRPC